MYECLCPTHLAVGRCSSPYSGRRMFFLHKQYDAINIESKGDMLSLSLLLQWQIGKSVAFRFWKFFLFFFFLQLP